MAITRISRPYLPGGLLDWLAWLCATCFRASTVVAAHTGGNFCSLRSTSGLTHVAEDLSMGYHTRLRGAHESDIQKLNFGPTLTFHLFAFFFFAVFLCCRVILHVYSFSLSFFLSFFLSFCLSGRKAEARVWRKTGVCRISYRDLKWGGFTIPSPRQVASR